MSVASLLSACLCKIISASSKHLEMHYADQKTLIHDSMLDLILTNAERVICINVINLKID